MGSSPSAPCSSTAHHSRRLRASWNLHGAFGINLELRTTSVRGHKACRRWVRVPPPRVLHGPHSRRLRASWNLHGAFGIKLELQTTSVRGHKACRNGFESLRPVIFTAPTHADLGPSSRGLWYADHIRVLHGPTLTPTEGLVESSRGLWY
jgi:hypothetical protein